MKREFWLLFSLTLHLRRRKGTDGGGGASRVAIHVTFRQILGLRILAASDLPSEPPFSLPLSQFSFCFYSLCLPTLVPAHIVTPPPHYPLSLHTVLGWGDAILVLARDAEEGQGGKSTIYSIRFGTTWLSALLSEVYCTSVLVKIAVWFHEDRQWGEKKAASLMLWSFYVLYVVLQCVQAV